MNRLVVQLSMAVLLVVACSSAYCLSPAKETYSVEVGFAQDSAAIAFEKGKLETLACRAKSLVVEVIIVVAHADKTEANAQQLSERRALEINKQLLLLGLPSARIYFESKGATQPVSTDEPDRNRVGFVELIGSFGDTPPLNCDPVWEKEFTELALSDAMMVAKSRVRDGLTAPHTPAVIAILSKRMDLLDHLLTGPDNIIMDADARVLLMRTAVLAGDTPFVERLISFGIKVSELKNPALPVVWAACDAKMSEAQRVTMIEALIAWGAKADGVVVYGTETSALRCAASRNSLAVAKVLLVNGANPDRPLSDPPILAGGRYPEMVRRLIAAGADARVKSNSGATLFHLFPFSEAKEVHWISDLGLNINARQESGYNGGTPLREAVSYAPLEVLDAFVARGASIDPGWPALTDNALRNFPGLIWLIDKGASLDGQRSIAHAAARKGDSGVPVIEALQRRGASLRIADEAGDTPLRVAIRGLAPLLVQRLVDFGVISNPGQATSEREFAERQPVRHVFSCVGCSESRRKELDSALNSDVVLAERQRNKDHIIEILKVEEIKP